MLTLSLLGGDTIHRGEDNILRSECVCFTSLLSLFPPAMYSSISICVFLAVLSASSFGQQTAGSRDGNPLAAELEQSLTEPHRHVRAPLSAGPLKSVSRLDGSMDQRANLGALLAKYLQQARKGTSCAAYVSVELLQEYLEVKVTLSVSSTNSQRREEGDFAWLCLK